jgi:predicted enzyme related to lactoylglutathione lyase
MSQITRHAAGTFCWADLATTDAAGAKQFYASLFGWDLRDVPMEDGGYYTMLQQQGGNVAGLGALPPDQQDRPPAWNVYAAVDDVDAVAARAAALGGTVLAAPFDVYDAGRMATLQDPTGAVVSLWQATNHHGADVKDEPGAVCWVELATRDTSRAGRFYADLFAWASEHGEFGGISYTTFTGPERPVGGMFSMTDEWGETPPHWLVYFAVADCQGAAAEAAHLGGRVLTPPTAIAGIGQFAILQDPQGAVFGVIAGEQQDA